MASRRGRRLVGLVTLVAMQGLALAVAGLYGLIPRGFGLVGIALFGACLVLVAVVGWQSRREMLAVRDEAARGQMIVMIAARLRDEDQATLERMVARGGPAGEAAGLILKGRAERKRPAPPAS